MAAGGKVSARGPSIHWGLRDFIDCPLGQAG
jgi:hypothetical protein